MMISRNGSRLISSPPMLLPKPPPLLTCTLGRPETTTPSRLRKSNRSKLASGMLPSNVRPSRYSSFTLSGWTSIVSICA